MLLLGCNNCSCRQLLLHILLPLLLLLLLLRLLVRLWVAVMCRVVSCIHTKVVLSSMVW
jgi:hypothetical protein